jgi:glycosyltransferase involved in cell wall biosynthesis
MRVLIVTQYFWPEEFRVNDLAEELCRRGHEVRVLTGQPSYPDRDRFSAHGSVLPWAQQWRGVRIDRVPMLSRGRGQGWRLALNFLSFAASATVLGVLRVRRRPDVIFVYQPSPVTVAIPAVVLRRLTGAPVVLWVQDLWPQTLVATGAVRSRRALRVIGRLVRWIYEHSDRILVESQAFIPHAVAAGADPGRVAYVPNWAESSYTPVDPPAGTPEELLLPDGFRIVFAGNLGTAQSLPTVLDAAERLRGHPDIQWVILGDGRRRRWLQQEVQSRGLSATVHLLGRHPVETMPTFFGLADALLVTLCQEPIYALTVPSKLQSYLACGRPVLGALDGEGAALVATSGAGIVVPAADGAGLAEAVLRLRALAPEQRTEMGQRARTYFLEHFDRDRLLDDLEDHLVKSAGERP